MLGLAAEAQSQARLEVPVFIPAGDGQAANCSLGEIVGLDPKGDNFLSVRSGPGGRPYREIDRLHTGQQVLLCDSNGPWLGVVYEKPRPGRSCGVERPSRSRWAYPGPCASGWVHGRYVRVTAG